MQGPTFERVTDKVYDLSISSDGEHVFAGVKFNNAVDWDADTGNRTLLERADGDTQAVQYSNGYLYMGFHDGYQSDVTLRLLALDPATGYDPDPTFMPPSNGYPGVYTLDADGNYLVAGRYSFGSGSGHSNWMGGGAIEMVDGEMVMAPSGPRRSPCRG